MYGRDLEEKTKVIIEWLSMHGLAGEKCRYSHYISEINNFYRAIVPFPDNIYKLFNNSRDSVGELLIINDIYDRFSEEKSIGFQDRLKKAINGPIYVNENSVHLQTKPDSSRDFLFELFVASWLSRLGYRLSFDDEADVFSSKNGINLICQCKRIYSKNKVERNIKKAGKQLKESISNHDKSIGMIVLDVSNFVFFSQVDEFDNDTDFMKIIDDQIDFFYDQHRSIINQENEKSFSFSMGVCLIASKTVWHGGGIFMAHAHKVIISPRRTKKEEEAIRRSLTGQYLPLKETMKVSRFHIFVWVVVLGFILPYLCYIILKRK
ncbi:hypothetical protein [Acetobacter lovaniensis]|uniref:Uncharacterized protein (UPF0147 family) n=2 Tax=Acetobacter lovaniensis TaxID=104100 RepID=A0A841QKJ2_9PROT|nr:hypothetical protein [Acetobacter lovaniensis]MBB6458805.1 uncharacterized protein (UPF0147 family) [Acetobacter lovaniensis]NHN82996.1 hypothetical protein [Acetobacter lovaniensis]